MKSATQRPRVPLAAAVGVGAAFAFFALFLVFFGSDLVRMAGQASFLGAFRFDRSDSTLPKTVAAAPRQPGEPTAPADGTSGAASSGTVDGQSGASGGGVRASAGGQAQKPSASRVVQLQLTRALSAHPRYQELVLLEREIAHWGEDSAGGASASPSSRQAGAGAAPTAGAITDSLDRSSASAYARDEGEMARSVTERVQEEQKRLELGAQQKVDWKRAQLADKLDEEVGLERDHRTKELEQFTADTNRRYAIKILNAKLRANILNTEVARRQADEEVSALETEGANLIEAEKEKHAKALTAYSAARAAFYDKQLADYAAQLSKEAETELSALRASLEETNAKSRQTLSVARDVSQHALNVLEGVGAAGAEPAGSGTLTGAASPGGKVPVGKVPAGLEKLLHQRDALLELMKNDVRRAAAMVAEEMGAGIVEFVPTPARADANDITARVMGILGKP